jgi:cytochrome c2
MARALGISLFFGLGIILVAVVLWSVVLPSTSSAGASRLGDASQGDANWGKHLLNVYGCGTCHAIPGVPGAHGHVGPPLGGFAIRAYIVGNLPNTFDNTVTWIRHPQVVEPGTIMPDLGVSQHNAEAMAAYLATLDE